MNCERARELFSGYVEGYIDHDAAASVRSHIDQCTSCSHELDLFRQTWGMLNTLPEIEAPSDFRHNVVMRVAGMQHQRMRGSRQGVWSLSWDSLFGRAFPARAVAIACAVVAFAIVLVKVPNSAYEHFTGMFRPGVGIVEQSQLPRPLDGIEASTLSQFEQGRKQGWQARKLRRNTVWVSIEPSENGGGASLYKVTLSINEKALLPGEATARIGAQVFLLPPNEFGMDSLESAAAVWQGSILKDSPVLIPVIVDQSRGQMGSVNLLVTYRFRHRDFSQIIFIPTQRRISAAPDVFDYSAGNVRFGQGRTDLYSTLQMIAQRYGVPIIARGDLSTKPSLAGSGGSLDTVLRQTLGTIGLDWLYADRAIYVDSEYEAVSPGLAE